MTSICPTVTATNPQDFQTQLERVLGFATRIHFDVADGVFTPRRLVDLSSVWWPGYVVADLHVMFKEPFKETELIVALHPQLVIIHAEADGDFMAFAKTLRSNGIETGVALLPETPVSLIAGAIEQIDHVLIFSGALSHFGGTADLSLLSKARELRTLKSSLEIGWDGGVSEHNAKQLADAGVDVLNVGGHIHQAPNPEEAFVHLKSLTSSV